MVCPVCPATGWLGGWIGGYFGILPPEHSGGRILSAVITANLITITIIALKVLFNVSLCVDGDVNLRNIVCVGAKTFIMGVIYSIGVNYLLNRYVFPHPEVKRELDDALFEGPTSPPPCCKCSKEAQRAEEFL